MKRQKQTILIMLLTLTVLAFLPAFAYADSAANDSAEDVEVLMPGVTQISSSNVLLGVRGAYEDASSDKLLSRINEIRKEACDEGIVSSYVPIKWSDSLEFIAQIRSVEASVLEDHVRPKGGYVFPMNVNSVKSYAENLAWGAKALGAVELWYSEKEDLVGKTGGVTGHYESLINPEYTHIGIGSFKAKGTWNCVCAEFTSASGITENRTGISGDCIQLIEVPKADVTLTVDGSDVAVGSSRVFTAKAGYKGYDLVLHETNWTSADESVATVSDGIVTGVSEGSTVITAELGFCGNASGLTAEKQVTVKAPPEAVTTARAIKGKKSFKVKWQKSEDATGYEIQYSLKKTMKGAALVTVGDVTSKKIKGLKVKKNYYVQIRAVNEAGESEWSKVIKVKTK